MPILRRHQLAYLTAAGWEEALRLPGAQAVAPQLRYWAAQGLPLVVTRQGTCTAMPGHIALGWPAPLRDGRQRVALNVAPRSVAWFDEFPEAHKALPLLPRGVRAPLQSLLAQLRENGVRPRIYGSYGWQLLSGLTYIHTASDFDLLLAVQGRDQADALVALLQADAPRALRIDGELLFPDGAAVAWREYAHWRAGLTRELLVKRLDSVALEPGVGLAREAGLVTTCAAPVAPVRVRTTERSTELAQ
jgi:phosphoribosyl-dephospho-CoA transferase